MNAKASQGQSVIEFAIGVMLLVVFLLGIPLVAKIANVNILSIQALDYAAWRARAGNTNNDSLTREIKDRYFGETALIVDDEEIINSGAVLGSGREGQAIYNREGILVQYQNTTAYNEIRLTDAYRLPYKEGAGILTITTPLQNTNLFPELSDSLVIKKSLYVSNETLAAKDARHSQERLSNMSATIIPYNTGNQKKAAGLLNKVISVWRPITGEHKLADVTVTDKAIPQDRLAEYRR